MEIRRWPWLLLGCLGLALPTGVRAASTTLQFEGLDGTDVTYAESGYSLLSDAVLDSASLGSPAPGLSVSIDGQAIALTRADGRSFDLLALDVIEVDALAGPRPLTIEATLLGGATVAQSFLSDGVEGAQTLVLASTFSDVVEIRWTGDLGLVLDAIRVSHGFDLRRAISGSDVYVEDGLVLRSDAPLTVLADPLLGDPAPALAAPLGATVHTLAPAASAVFTVASCVIHEVVGLGTTLHFMATAMDGSIANVDFVAPGLAGSRTDFAFPFASTPLRSLSWSGGEDLVLDAFEVTVQAGPVVDVRSAQGGTATVFSLPDGNGRRFDQAWAWSGVAGVLPATVDATLHASIVAADGAPVEGAQIDLVTTLGGVAFCADGAAFDAPTDATGIARLGRALAAGGASDLAAGERASVVVRDEPAALVLHRARLVASRSDGSLYEIDPVTASAQPSCLGAFPDGATEIAYDLERHVLWMHPPGLAFEMTAFDLAACSASTNVIPTGSALNGLEFVGGDLYGVGITSPCGDAQLVRIDVETGTLTAIGAPQPSGAMAGLAFDRSTGVLYGVSGCANTGGSDLVTIDLASGVTHVVGALGVALGSIEFGPDGRLYGVGNNTEGGRLYRIDPTTAALELVGHPQRGGFTGLALVADDALDLEFNSADMDADLLVNLVDVGLFAGAYADYANGGPALFAADFVRDGVINLQDVGQLGFGVGTQCAPAPVAVTVADDVTVSLRFERSGGRDVLDAAPGSVLRADVVLEGDLADGDLRAWATRVRTSPSLELVELTPAEGAFEVGTVGVANEIVAAVPTGGALTRGTRVVGQLRLRVLGPEAGFVYFEGLPSMCGDAQGLAVVAAGSTSIVEIPAPAGRGAAVGAVNATLTEGAPIGPADLPERFSVAGAPNPFNPVTVLRFAMPVPGRAVIEVFDLAGRRVTRLPAGSVEAGEHSVRWDGTDARGRRVTSGVYLARLVVDGLVRGNVAKLALVE